jgi:hypothetical protein
LHGLLDRVLVSRDEQSRKEEQRALLAERVQIVLNGGTTLPAGG